MAGLACSLDLPYWIEDTGHAVLPYWAAIAPIFYIEYFMRFGGLVRSLFLIARFKLRAKPYRW